MSDPISGARRKNLDALKALGGEALAARLESRRIGIWTTDDSNLASGVLLAEALGDVLGRFWRHLEAVGPLADLIAETARSAAASGRQPTDARVGWNPPYDFALAVGTDLPPGAATAGLRIGGTGWTALVGSAATVSEDRNPIGPAAAAAVAADEMFKTLFSDALGDRARPLPVEFRWSAWDYGENATEPGAMPLRFEDLHVFGVGAVTHGMLWVMERWPADISGDMHLVDQDAYGESNGQRYAGMHAGDLGLSKPGQAARRLRARHPHLNMYPHDCVDMNRYFAEMRPDCRVRLAVAGMDNPEHRRQLALKLPMRVVNMWTEGDRLGAARFGIGDGWPCLYCAYPEDVSVPLDDVGRFWQETGLLPPRVRELLNSGAGLEARDVAVIARRYALSDPQSLVGEPLRSIRGVLCASAPIALPEAADSVDVPLAFASLLAGIGGFVELARELWQAPSQPGHWQLPVLTYPVAGNWFPRGPRRDCYLCSDSLTREVLDRKYGS